MTEKFTIEAAEALTNDELIAEFQIGFLDMGANLRKACICLTILERRGAVFPLQKNLPTPFRFAPEIAADLLDPEAALLLAGSPDAIRAVMKLPLDQQRAVANEKPIKIAIKKDGRIISAERTIYEMSVMQMRIAFGENGIVPWEQQGEFLHKSGAPNEGAPTVRVKPKIAVDGTTHEIVVNKIHVTVDDLIPALAALGYSVKKLYKDELAPVKVK